MNGSQKAVLWMGLILVILNLNWSGLKQILFTGVASSPGVLGGGSGGILGPGILGGGIVGGLIPVSTPVQNQGTTTQQKMV